MGGALGATGGACAAHPLDCCCGDHGKSGDWASPSGAVPPTDGRRQVPKPPDGCCDEEERIGAAVVPKRCADRGAAIPIPTRCAAHPLDGCCDEEERIGAAAVPKRCADRGAAVPIPSHCAAHPSDGCCEDCIAQVVGCRARTCS